MSAQGYSNTSDFRLDITESWCDMNSYITATLYTNTADAKSVSTFRIPPVFKDREQAVIFSIISHSNNIWLWFIVIVALTSLPPRRNGHTAFLLSQE